MRIPGTGRAALAVLLLMAGAQGALAQNCAVDFEALDFGAVLLGDERLRALTVSNEGGAALALDVPAQPCPALPAFTVLTSGHFELGPGASQVLQIRFSPDAPGEQACTLDLGTNDCPPVALSGWGMAPSEPAGDHIGLYLDSEAQICQAPLDGPLQTVQVRVLAVLPGFAGEAISACEFRLDGLPPNNPPAGYWTAEWTTPLVIGDPSYGIALAWTTPQPGPIIEIGTLTFASLQDGEWIGPDHELRVRASLSGDGIHIVDAETATELSVGGGLFTFNCGDPPQCPCFIAALPHCSLQPGSLNFGVVAVGYSAQQSFHIWNTGGGVLSGVVSEDCPDFEILAGGGAFGLAAGQMRTVQVSFTPQSEGPLSCDIDLGTVDCPDLGCSGIGYLPGPICEVYPSQLGFGELAVGDAHDLSFTIRNAGTGLLEGTVSELCPDFAIIAGGGPYALGAHESRAVVVRFSPSAPGPQSCAIELDSPYCEAVPCTGSAHEPAYGCDLTPTALYFGDLPLGESEDRQARLENTGDLVLTGALSVEDPNYAIIQNGGPYSLAPGDSRLFVVRFTPLETGEHPATLETGNAHCGELLLYGSAHVPAPLCVLHPTAIDFGDLFLGTAATASFTVRNEGDAPLIGDITLASEHFHLLAGGGPFTLVPWDSRLVTLRYFPQAYGAHSAEVDLGAAACATLPLSGFGRNPTPGGDHIGLYLDAAGSICTAEAPVGVPLSLYLIASVPSFAEPGITGLEFRVAGLDTLADLATIDMEWVYPPADGDLATGIRFDFAAPQPGASIALGQIEILPLAALPPHHLLQLARSLDGEQLRVTDAAGTSWDVGGDQFTLNCVFPPLCDCIDFTGGSCELSTTALDFGTVYCLDSSVRSFTLSNVGFGPLAGELAISGNRFSLSEGEGPFLLDPGESLTAEVTFSPFQPGEYTAQVTTGLADCPRVHCTGVGVENSGYPTLGVFADDACTICELDQQPFVTATVKVAAVLPEWMQGITAAEFSIHNLPVSGAGGIRTDRWNTALVIGEPGYGIALAFNPPLWGPVARLGELDFYELQTTWIGANHMMEVAASQNSGQLVVVDTHYDEYWCIPSVFTFNCWGFCDCYYVTPVALGDFSLEDLAGAARIHWTYAGGGDAEFRLEGERDGLAWLVPWTETAPGQCLAEDRSAALASAGTVHYRLLGRLDGESWQPLREEALVVSGLPLRTALLAAHPNPFNPQVTLPFTLGKAGRARLAIYDVAGRQLRQLLDAELTAGPRALVWDGRDAAGRPVGSGVYFIRFEAAGVSASQKLILLR